MSVTESRLSPLSFTYSIRRSQRKTAALHVTAQGVQVRIPHGVTDAWVEQFVHDKQAWVEKQLAALAQRQLPQLAIGQSLLWRGQAHLVCFQPQPHLRSHHVTVQKQKLVVHGPKCPSAQLLLRIFSRFFMDQAKQHMVPLTEHMALHIHQRGQLSDIVFRRTKRKWGHCTSAGRIQYNWLIMGAPDFVVEYLICHEVCHLRHAHHGREFWQLLKQVCAHSDKAKAWLKQHGHELMWC